MKRVLIIVTVVFMMISDFAFAKPINSSVYKTMYSNSYRNNYRSQVNNQTIPYWQAQSNFATRNRYYPNYTNYNNSVNQFNYSNRIMRGTYR